MLENCYKHFYKGRLQKLPSDEKAFLDGFKTCLGIFIDSTEFILDESYRNDLHFLKNTQREIGMVILKNMKTLLKEEWYEYVTSFWDNRFYENENITHLWNEADYEPHPID